MRIAGEPFNRSHHRMTRGIPDAHAEQPPEGHRYTLPNVDPYLGNRILKGLGFVPPHHTTTAASATWTGTTAAWSTISLAVVGQEAVLELIELAVLFVDFIQGARIELVLAPRVDLVCKLPDLF